MFYSCVYITFNIDFYVRTFILRVKSIKRLEMLLNFTPFFDCYFFLWGAVLLKITTVRTLGFFFLKCYYVLLFAYSFQLETGWWLGRFKIDLGSGTAFCRGKRILFSLPIKKTKQKQTIIQVRFLLFQKCLNEIRTEKSKSFRICSSLVDF